MQQPICFVSGNPLLPNTPFRLALISTEGPGDRNDDGLSEALWFERSPYFQARLTPAGQIGLLGVSADREADLIRACLNEPSVAQELDDFMRQHTPGLREDLINKYLLPGQDLALAQCWEQIQYLARHKLDLEEMDSQMNFAMVREPVYQRLLNGGASTQALDQKIAAAVSKAKAYVIHFTQEAPGIRRHPDWCDAFGAQFVAALGLQSNPHTHKAVHDKAERYWAGYIEKEQFLAAARPDIELAFFKAGLKRAGIPLSPSYEQVYIQGQAPKPTSLTPKC